MQTVSNTHRSMGPDSQTALNRQTSDSMSKKRSSQNSISGKNISKLQENSTMGSKRKGLQTLNSGIYTKSGSLSREFGREITTNNNE